MGLRKFMSIAVSLLILSLHAVHAQSGKEGLAFDSTLWDFGTVRDDAGPVMHSFSFRNHGTSAVRLDRVSVSCSCVKVYTGETSFAPGERGDLTVSFDPAGLYGDQEKTVTIFSGSSRIMLDIRGKVLSQRVDDTYAVDLGSGLRIRTMDLNFGVIYPDEKFLGALSLWNTSDRDVTVSASGMPSCIRIIGGGTIPPGERMEIDVVCEIPDSPSVYGSLSGRFALEVNGTAVPRSVTVSARCIEKTPRSATVKPRMEISAKELDARRFFWQSEASASLEITNTGNGNLKVLKVETEGIRECSLKSGMQLAPGKSVRLGVSLPGASGTVRLFTNDPVRPYLEIPCRAR